MNNKTMDNLKSYRLTSMEEPTDEQLAALMAQVGEDARESSRSVQAELQRRMDELQRLAREEYCIEK